MQQPPKFQQILGVYYLAMIRDEQDELQGNYSAFARGRGNREPCGRVE